MAERDGKGEQLEQEVESQRRKENKPDEYREGKRRLSAPSCSAPNPKRAHLTTVGKTENENNKEDGTQDCNSNPPRLNFEVLKLSDLPKACSKSWNDVELPVDFLLLTVEDCEFLGFFPYLEEPFKSYRKDVGYVWFGYMGSTVGSVKKLKIALMKCSKGSAVPGGSLTVIKNAVRVLKPKSVFSVGACCGLNRGKVKLGDVVVSSKLITPTHKTPASRDIGTLIRHAADGWNAPLANPDALEVRVHCDGAVLSSPEVISEDLIQQYPEAIAVDTEGEGVFAAAHDLKTEWVLIKGIKDYADGSQPSSDEWGRFASVMAASVVANILSDPVVFEEWSNYNQEASPVDSFDVKTCQRKLAEHCRKTAKVPTTAWSSVIQEDLDKIYTRLSWVAGSSQKELSHYTELFTEKTKNGAVPKRILVQGETGIGKTTFVKRLLVDWSNLEGAKMEEAQEREGAQKKFSECKDNEDVIEDIEESSTHIEDMNKYGAKMEEERKDVLRKFELVLSVNPKDVSKCQTLKEVISHSRLLPRDEESSIDDLLCHIQKHQKKVLFVFDGYDEYRTGSEAEEKYGSRSSSPIYEIFHGNILRDCTVLVTTRTSRADEIREPADIQAEITGFNRSDKEDFMKKMLESYNQVYELLQFLEKSKMEDLARVPLLTLFFCLLWKEEKEKLKEHVRSKTKLFRAIVKHILQHSHRKHSPSHVSKLKETDYKEILAEIGKVALEGLLKGDLMFEYDQLPEKVRGEESIIVGLLQVFEYGPSLEPMEMVSFIHKSIQEYLAAWYITYRCVPEGSLGGIEQRARTLEDCVALENVFQFICGLSDEGAVKILDLLTSVRVSDPTLDFSKTIPDVENETDVPLCDVTNRHDRFSGLVYDSFQDVRSKAELLSHCFDCTGRVILVTRDRPISKLVPNVNVLTKLPHYCVFLFKSICFGINEDKDSEMYESLEFLNCLHVPLTIPESSKILTVGDLRVGKDNFPFFHTSDFSSILCCRNGQFQFYITKLFLGCDDHARPFTEFSTGSASSAAASLCSEQSCLKFLRSLCFSKLSGQTVKALAAVIRNCKHLNRVEVRKSDDTVCDLLEQVSNPSKCSLTIGSFSHRFNVHLTSAGAVKLGSLLPLFNNIITLGLDLNDCCSQAVDALVTSITHKTLKELVLNRISLTSTAAAALGRSLPEMSSLQEFGLTGISGSTLQAEDMVALFGRFNKTLSLSKLTFSDFSVTGCLAPLTKSFQFFPYLEWLKLEKLNMDEDDQCRLLESFRFTRNLMALHIQGKRDGHAHCYTTRTDVLDLRLDGKGLTLAVATALGRSLPEMSSLKILQLTGVDGSILQTQEIEALFAGVNKTLPLRCLIFSGFSVTGCLTPLFKSLSFFPSLTELKLEMLNMTEHSQCSLLESLKFISNLTALSVQSKPLYDVDRCSAILTLNEHWYDKSLNLNGINLTPAVAAALALSLPDMSSLQTLVLTAARDGSILQGEDLDALFGGFNKTLPLHKFTFCNFSASIAPLTNSFRFFPNLRELFLGGFSVNEHNLCCLLDSLRFVPNLLELEVLGEPLSYSHCLTVEVNTIGGFTHRALERLVLSEITLTPAVVKVLGQSLPGMLSLQTLKFTGVNGSVLETEELVVLFGRFNKRSPLRELIFSDFSIKSSLAPLIKTLCFFPDFRMFGLEKLHRAEQDQCSLLESLRFIPNLTALKVQSKPLDHADCCTAKLTLTSSSYADRNNKSLSLNGISLTPAAAAVLGRLLTEMVALEELELTGVEESILEADLVSLFGGFNRTLPLYKFNFSHFSVRSSIAPLTNSFRFFPNLRVLCLGGFNVDEHNLSCLLDSLRFLPNLKTLTVWSEPLSYPHCSTSKANIVGGFTHKALEELRLFGIILTPAAAVALGQSFPEMSSLQTLELTGVDGSILQPVEMEALFGGFNKTLSLSKLTFSDFSIKGCLAPLTKSFRFFPNLIDLDLQNLNMSEDDLCGLLENFRFTPNLEELNLSGNPLDHAVKSIVPHVSNLLKLQELRIYETGHGWEDMNYVRDSLKQALPELCVYDDELHSGIPEHWRTNMWNVWNLN